MADTLETTHRAEPDEKVVDEKRPAKRWRWLALTGVMLISLFMNFYQLGQNGFGNLYYAAGVRSMLDNLHNFFFVSYDPGGFVTLDKPPLGFWLQVISAKIFGFTAFSVYLPQALAGVLSVALLYHLVRRHFGEVAGLLAALALALSPISVVTNRNNTIDSTLALALLLGAWAVLKAAETGKLRWLLLSAVAVGIGFNIKMMEAYLVVPAYGLLYLLAAPKSIWRRIVNLALAALLLLSISLSSVLVVDMTPASQRPYVGSTQDNSELSLAIGYNGIQRLIGQFGFGTRNGNGNTNAGSNNQFPNGNGTPPFQPPQGTGQSGQPDFPTGRDFPVGQTGQRGQGGPGGGFDIGTAGPFRLFIEPLASQTAWLLPMAILGMLALAWQRRPRFQSDRQQQSLLLWGMWLLTMGVFFSVAGFFHQYYLTEMAPAIAALFGIGVVTMWRDYQRGGRGNWRGWLLPLALVATAVEQLYILTNYPAWGQWLIPIIALLCVLGAAALLILRNADFGEIHRQFLVSALSIALLGLMIAPTIWAGIPVIENVQAQLPVAGPTQQGNFGGFGGANNGLNVDSALISYLEAHQGSAKYLVAVASSNQADSIILATNKPVMALGGFSGSDPILTTSQLATLVKNGTVKYFLLGSGGFAGGPGGGQSSLTSWVTQNCTALPSSQWQSSASTSGNTFGANQLYICHT